MTASCADLWLLLFLIKTLQTQKNRYFLKIPTATSDHLSVKYFLSNSDQIYFHPQNTTFLPPWPGGNAPSGVGWRTSPELG